MYPDELFLGINLYGIMLSLGLLAAFLVLFLYSRRLAIGDKFVDFVFYNGIVAVVAGFLSAAVFQGLYNYIENPAVGFRIDGGITFMGGLIGGAASFLAGYFIFRKKYKERLGDVLPILTCSILIAHALGRVGCFFAGCCHGRETDSIWGIKFPKLPHAVFPTNLYEAIFLFLLFAVFSVMLLKYKKRNIFSLYLIAYGVFRFLVEFLRGDHRGEFVVGLSPSQFWSIAFVIAGIVLYVITAKRQNISKPSLEDTAQDMEEDVAANTATDSRSVDSKK